MHIACTTHPPGKFGVGLELGICHHPPNLGVAPFQSDPELDDFRKWPISYGPLK